MPIYALASVISKAGRLKGEREGIRGAFVKNYDINIEIVEIIKKLKGNRK